MTRQSTQTQQGVFSPVGSSLVPWWPSAEELSAQALTQARALPAAFYTSASSLEWERRQLFPRHWQLLAHAEQLSECGDHVVSEIADQPLLLVRDQQAQLRAFHNVCRHRAGPLALCSGRGAKALRCRYHGWVYSLDGALRGAPEMEGAADFALDQIRLPQVSVGHWRGLVLAALDPAHDIQQVFKPIEQRLSRADTAQDWSDYRFYRRISYEIACNWKVYIDNFLEGYHLPLVHPGLNRLLDYRAYQTELGPWHSLQWSPLERTSEPVRVDGVADVATNSAVAGTNFYGCGDALYFFVYPNMMLNILPGRLQTNRVTPLAVDRCRVDFDYYYPSTATTDASWSVAAASMSVQAEQRVALDQSFSDEVQQEDIAICEAVQRGLAGGSYTPGRLNPKRESGVHHFHELLRRSWRESLA